MSNESDAIKTKNAAHISVVNISDGWIRIDVDCPNSGVKFSEDLNRAEAIELTAMLLESLDKDAGIDGKPPPDISCDKCLGEGIVKRDDPIKGVVNTTCGCVPIYKMENE